ncbi:deoxyribodipyrimidine photo-lyase [Tepiditoga spiralis]|uniref:Deoxyribodipyrimidine photo-lyase n=1 Tax=Tepiditoga spiralis TaxID=2108365 RepID=A0A7G1G8S6_9BACT|nr:radical SAM protein [Tepiditoga spiralis]BBE31323.1 deoxyribodipyrimidine photo-lyase [Tepiditoga spiralis]
MKSLNKNYLNKYFSHIYIEKEAYNYKITEYILNKFNKASKILINNYKEIFNRNKQNFIMQKKSPKLILAVKKNNLIYKGAEVCHDFNNENFYYTSSIFNCVYNCKYCYLGGMYTSANIVIFVNIEDYFKKIKKLENPYISISYDTDLMAFENIYPFTKKWIEFASKNKDIKLEIRTKSSNFKSIKDMVPQQNVILGWTVSPQEIIDKFEKQTPSLDLRIESINEAINKGWIPRLSIDPILKIDEFERIYSEFIEYLFQKIPANKIKDLSIGVFRMPLDYLKRMRKSSDNFIVYYPYENINGVYTYSKEEKSYMINYVKKELNKYIDKEKVFEI